MDVNISQEKINSAVLEQVIQINAFQRATTSVMIELLSKSEQDGDEAIQLLNEEFQKNLSTILEDIYVRHGNLDLGDLFKK